MRIRLLFLLLLTAGCPLGTPEESEFTLVGVYRGTWAVMGTVPGGGTQAVGCAGRIAITAQFGPQVQGNMVITENATCAAATADFLTGNISADGAVTLAGSSNARFTLNQLNCVASAPLLDLQGRFESGLMTVRHVKTVSCEGSSGSVNLELTFTGSR